MGLVDEWRDTHPNVIATTWTERKKNKKTSIRTRIDRALIDERIQDRITEIEIDKTRVSDHDLVRWNLLSTDRVTKQQHNRIPIEMIDDPEYKRVVKQIYEEEQWSVCSPFCFFLFLWVHVVAAIFGSSKRSAESAARGAERGAELKTSIPLFTISFLDC